MANSIRIALALGLGGLAIAGCSTRRTPVAPPPPPPAPVAAAPELPPGASPGMLVPTPLADGSFPTPNRSLYGDAALWHLRAGLNVAALSCGGAEGDALRAAYNRWLTRDRIPLSAAQKRYAAGYASADAYDDAMTRLYNYYSQTPVRSGLCAAADTIAARLDAPGDAGLTRFAETSLPALDQPFRNFYAAYDAWRRGQAGSAAVVAVASPAPVAVRVASAETPARPAPAPPAPARSVPPTPAVPPARARPALVLDLNTLPLDAEVAGPR